MANPPDRTELAAFSVDVVRRLRKAGYVAYWAGGCVRDHLLRRDPKDYDVATSAYPEQVQRLFRRSLPIGAAFGVIQVRGRGGLSVEVATFRSDGNYSDGRHPDSITFSGPEEDAKRRDFTINGMFLDPMIEPVEDGVLDFVGGREDLSARVIRAIGDPRERFAEDKLRMLRAVRFAAQLSYTIEPGSRDAIVAMASQIEVVSAERILAELRLMLEGSNRGVALDLLRDTGLFHAVMPEFATVAESEEAWSTALSVVSWPRRAALGLVLAGLAAQMDDATADAACESLLRRLRSSNEDRELTQWLLRHRHSLSHSRSLAASQIKRLLAQARHRQLLDLVETTERSLTGGTANVEHVRSLQKQWTSHDIDPPALLTGDDLVRLGYQPGRLFKEILEQVRDAQLDGVLMDPDGAADWVRSRWSV